MKKELVNNLILDIALEEFGAKGFQLASTNIIAKRSQVSKGLIFKRYHSKLGVYSAVLERELAKVVEGLIGLMNEVYEDTSFVKMAKIVAWKIEYARKFPAASSLMLEALSNTQYVPTTKTKDLLAQMEPYSVAYVFNDLDWSKFAPLYNKQQVISNLEIALNGLQSTFIRPPLSLVQQVDVSIKCIDYLQIILIGMEQQNGKSF